MKKEKTCPHSLFESMEYSLMTLDILLDKMTPADAKYLIKETTDILSEADKRLKALADVEIKRK